MSESAESDRDPLLLPLEALKLLHIIQGSNPALLGVNTKPFLIIQHQDFHCNSNIICI